MSDVSALSVLDGRYARNVMEMRDIFSEYGLMYHRLFVEIEWLKFILTEFSITPLTQKQLAEIDSIYKGFNSESAMMVKEIEKRRITM